MDFETYKKAAVICLADDEDVVIKSSECNAIFSATDGTDDMMPWISINGNMHLYRVKCGHERMYTLDANGKTDKASIFKLEISE